MIDGGNGGTGFQPQRGVSTHSPGREPRVPALREVKSPNGAKELTAWIARTDRAVGSFALSGLGKLLSV